MRIAFFGTPDAAVPALRALVDAGHDVEMVITRPDRRRGRGGELSHSPVHIAASELDLRVGHALADLEGVDVERAVVVAYGAMIPERLLERIPMLNVHFSILPRWRGAAPVERAILAGDEETGVTIMTLEPELDTGPVHLVRRVPVDAKTAAELTDELAREGAAALIEVLASPALLAKPEPQHGPTLYAEKLRAETFHLEPTMTRDLFLRTVRLGRAFTIVAGRRLRILAAHTVPTPTGVAGTMLVGAGWVALCLSDGVVELDEVQSEGNRSMSGSAWWLGARLDPRVTRWA